MSFRKKLSDSLDIFSWAFMLASLFPLAAAVAFVLNLDFVEFMEEYFAVVGALYIGSIEIWLNPENIEKMAGEKGLD